MSLALAAAFWLAVSAADANPPYWQLGRYALSYIPDDSDALTISLTCQKEPFVGLEIPLREGARQASIRLVSGAHQGRYRARVTTDELGAHAKGRISRSDPLLKAFRDTGKLTVAEGWEANAASARERRAIAAFFASCPLG